MEEVVWFILVIIISIFFIITKQKKKNWPRSPPGALPIIGHLHLRKSPQHRTFQSLSNQYGPILFLHLGSRPVLLISSPTIAEQCFTKQDIIFANRPKSTTSKVLGYNHTTMGFAPYSDHWRNLLRITSIEIFSSASLQRTSDVRMEEIRFAVKKLTRESNGSTRKVNLRSVFFELVFNEMMRMATGKRWENLNWGDIFKPILAMDIGDYVPIVRWVGFNGLEKKLRKLHRKRDEFWQSLLEEELVTNKLSNGSEKKTIMKALLSLQEDEPQYYTHDILKGIILVLKMAQSEIDNHVKPGQILEDSDLPKLSYLRNIINETLRLFPVAPLLLPHFSSQDRKIEGFDIPSDTTLLVNAWAIHRDLNLWEESTKFKPERFDQGEKELGFKFIPFGMGRRACPGAALAMRFVGLALGTFIQCFEWERVGPDLVDLDEDSGITVAKAKSLEALYKPRDSMSNITSLL